jgi:hypothetical protein
VCLALGLPLASPAALAAPCPSISVEGGRIAQALADVDLEQAAAIADQALESLGCQPEPVNTIALASLLQAAGVAALFGGDQALARERFAQAVAVSPTAQPDPMYGQTVLALYGDEQQRVLAMPAASLLVQGADELWVDGRTQPSGPPIDLLVGSHLLQWRVAGTALEARMVDLASGERHEILVGEAALARAAEEQPWQPRWPRLGLRIGSTAALVGGGVMLYGAAMERQAFYSTTKPEKLEGYLQENHSYTILGYGLAAAGTAGLGVSFFVADGPGLALGGRF